MAIQFDTLRYVEKLKSAGIPEAQAAAFVTALGESASRFLATKSDCTSIKSKAADIRSDLKLMTLMLVVIMTGVMLLVAKAFF